jgi:hypothetical protein
MDEGGGLVVAIVVAFVCCCCCWRMIVFELVILEWKLLIVTETVNNCTVLRLVTVIVIAMR